jgi:RimJ/RimL family protein N-acetyltransferase
LKLQEALGFVREGCLRKERYIQGEYVDDIRFGMLKEEYLTSPLSRK